MCHSFNGFTGQTGKESAKAFRNAATGGDDIPIRIFWPNTNNTDDLMSWALKFEEPPEPEDANYTALSDYGYQFVEYKAQHVDSHPHLMLYLLHEREAPHTVHRVAVGSTNFSAAAWSRIRRDHGLEVRSFELMVSFPPQQKVHKTYDAATRSYEQQSFVESLPFKLADTRPCTRPIRKRR